VLTREGSFLPFLAALCRNPRVRGFYEAHDFHADLSWHDEPPSLQDHKQSWLEQFCLPRISGVIGIVAPQADLYAARFPRLPVVSLPLGTTPRDPGDLEARRALGSLVYVGHLHASKGVSLLLRVAQKARARGGPCPLQHVRFVGGSAEQVARFRTEAAELGALTTVSFSPFVPPGELHRILADEVSLGAVPLKDTFYNARLTCPAKALDYLAHGLPVLASDLPSTRDILGASARFVEGHDAGAWFKAAKQILRDPAQYQALSAAAWKRAADLAWPVRARRLVDFVESVARR
jgi:glycosyltransferase involved in cell wall biosynthesis